MGGGGNMPCSASWRSQSVRPRPTRNMTASDPRRSVKTGLPWKSLRTTGSQIKEVSELETKTHLHVYINNQVGNAPITNPFSLPFHQDNGLFLMLTPSDKLPVVLKDLQGRPVLP